jgi:tetratricopeptide (TPR) repeat protein
MSESPESAVNSQSPKSGYEFYLKGHALGREGRHEDALLAFSHALSLDPNLAIAWAGKGFALGKLGRYEEEIECCEKAISLDPGNAEAWFNKGYALAGMQRYDEAIAAFDKVRVIDPSYPNLQKNQEIAQHLRDMTGGSPVTTGSGGQATAPETTPSESSAQQPGKTPTRPVPLSGVAGVIAVLGTGFLILQRK